MRIQPARIDPVFGHDTCFRLGQRLVEQRSDQRVCQRLPTQLMAAQVAEIGQDSVPAVVDVELARRIRREVIACFHADNLGHRTDPGGAIHRQFLVWFDDDQGWVFGAQFGGQRWNHPTDDRIHKANVPVQILMQLGRQDVQNHAAEGRRGVFEVLTDDDVERHFVASRRASRDARGHQRRDEWQRAHADRGCRDVGGCHVCRHRFCLAGQQRAHWCNRDLLHPVVVHQAYRVLAACLHGCHQRLIDVDEYNFVAALGKQLAQKAAPDIAGAEYKGGLCHDVT